MCFHPSTVLRLNTIPHKLNLARACHLTVDAQVWRKAVTYYVPFQLTIRLTVWLHLRWRYLLWLYIFRHARIVEDESF